MKHIGMFRYIAHIWKYETRVHGLAVFLGNLANRNILKFLTTFKKGLWFWTIHNEIFVKNLIA